MSLRNAGIVYRKEFTEAIRDRRTLVSTILVPLLVFPLLTAGFGYLSLKLIGKARTEVQRVMVLGGAGSPDILQGIRKLDSIEVLPPAADYAQRIVNKEIQAAVDVPPGFQAALARGDAPTIKIYMYEGEIKSSFGAERVEKFLSDYRTQLTQRRLAAAHLSPSLLKPFEVQQENVAPPEKVGGAALGGVVGYVVILLCLTGAMYPAMDLTAGEKERGTMETILTSPVGRTDLVLGKFLLVLSASLFTAVLSVFSMGASFYLLGKTGGLVARPGSLVLAISFKAVAVVFLMALPVAVLFSAALLSIALFARSYKEAQTYLTPLTFLVVIPAIGSLLPGAELNARLALVPILNVSLLCKEIVSGTYHWNYIALIFLSACLYAAAAVWVAVKLFQRESVLFRS